MGAICAFATDQARLKATLQGFQEQDREFERRSTGLAAASASVTSTSSAAAKGGFDHGGGRLPLLQAFLQFVCGKVALTSPDNPTEPTSIRVVYEQAWAVRQSRPRSAWACRM